MLKLTKGAIAFLFPLLLLPSAASAQSAIAGVVKDATGAVLPGVTVEAASPALTEKVRTANTDEQGQYKIVDLRPGVYTVTFALAGFNTVKREGIELTTTFTAAVNADMKVGAIEETVTVSGATPVVDIQNTIQTRVMTRDVIDSIPTGRSLQNMGALVPGMVNTGFGNAQDVGGTYGENNAQMAIHGGRAGDTVMQFDGMRFNNFTGTGSNGAIMTNDADSQEVSYQTGAISAEHSSGGVHVNMVPREGGNTFKAIGHADFTNHSLQSNNLNTDLQGRGLRSVDKVDRIYAITASLGGPILKDKLWFYFGHWNDERDILVAGNFYRKDPKAFRFDPKVDQDLSRPALDNLSNSSQSLRLTWQATPKNKFNAYFDHTERCVCHWFTSALITPEASVIQRGPFTYLTQATWSSPVTTRLLFEAGMSIHHTIWTQWMQEGIDFTTYSANDNGNGWRYRAAASYGQHPNHQPVSRGSVSYVTGTHALKVGFNLQQGTMIDSTRANNDATLTFTNGASAFVTYSAPVNVKGQLRADLGMYAQDQWTMGRATLNLGLRWDYLNARVPPQSVQAGLFVPARQFPDPVLNVPNWKDFNPRLGGVYDLFGNGKTAVKASVSRYVAGQTLGLATANNPVTTTSNTATRAWTDFNADGIPQGDPLNPLPNEELTGPLTNPNFGKVVVTTHYDPTVLNGWGTRGYNWEVSTSVQHELIPRVSVGAAYFRRWYGNFTVTDNRLRTPSDFDPYCVTAPSDARLPGGGGNRICGFYDVTSTKFSATTDNLVTKVSNYGAQTEGYNGIDLTISARTQNGVLLSGGLNTGRTSVNNCFVVDSPQPTVSGSGAFGTIAGVPQGECQLSTPFLTQVKALGAYTLPWQAVQLSAAFQSLPGPMILATWAAPNTTIALSLNRPLSGNVTNATVQLIEPGTLYSERVNQIDFRVAKAFQLRGEGRKVQLMLDLYNALNANPVLGQNNTFGSQSWLTPTSILQGRLVKFGTQIYF